MNSQSQALTYSSGQFLLFFLTSNSTLTTLKEHNLWCYLNRHFLPFLLTASPRNLFQTAWGGGGIKVEETKSMTVE